MKVSLDGGRSFVEAQEGVRVIVDLPAFINDDLTEEHDATLQINLTEEGIILDVTDDSTNDNVGTSSQTFEEMASELLLN